MVHLPHFAFVLPISPALPILGGAVSPFIRAFSRAVSRVVTRALTPESESEASASDAIATAPEALVLTVTFNPDGPFVRGGAMTLRASTGESVSIVRFHEREARIAGEPLKGTETVDRTSSGQLVLVDEPAEYTVRPNGCLQPSKRDQGQAPAS